MPSISGKYQHYKNVDIDDYYAAIGVPYLARKAMLLSSPSLEITLDGDKMTIKQTSMIRTSDVTFKLGEEYEEKMPDGFIKSVTKIINDQEMETISFVPQTNEKFGRHYLFTDDECIVTLTHDKAKTPAKRYFKRVQ